MSSDASEMSERMKLPEGYKPAKGEPYMNPMQLEYFRQRLFQWRETVLEESRQTTLHRARDTAREASDDADRASRETEFSFELRTRERHRRLLSAIGAALQRIDDESYGFCDETGEPIGLKRLEARPIATLSLEAQERRERREHQYPIRR